MLINECSFKTIVLIGDLFIFGNWTYDNYDGEDIIQEYDGNNQVTATYTHGPGIDEPICLEKNNQKYYYITDGLGSITAIVDQNGNVVQSYRYDSFGNIVNSSGTLSQPFTYTGREFDAETGLYYYRARYMDPKTGRFLQEDPVWNTNLYAYCNNDPINWIDPRGLFRFYGNYGGPDWTGAQTRPYESLSPAEQKALPAPIDDMDILFLYHDMQYSYARVKRDKVLNDLCASDAAKQAANEEYKAIVRSADRTLGRRLKLLGNDPRNWRHPAPDPDLARKKRREAELWF